MQSDNFHKRRRRGSEISGRRRLSAAHTKLKFIGSPFIILAGNRWALPKKFISSIQHVMADYGLILNTIYCFFVRVVLLTIRITTLSSFSALGPTFFYCCFSAAPDTFFRSTLNNISTARKVSFGTKTNEQCSTVFNPS